MTSQQEGILTLVKSALTAQAYPLPADFSLAEASPVALQHGIATMLYYGAEYCGIPKEEPIMHKLVSYCYSMVFSSEKQLFAVKKLLQLFQENNIDCLPLKGVILKKLYPKPEMRRMGDADILIRTSQYPQIKQLMESSGYTFLYETDHEIVWKNESLTLELHKKLIPERNKEFYAYFGSGWDLAIPVQGSRCLYEFSDENTMLFLFAHLAKHYTGGGIGIQHMTDLWIYQHSHPNLDQDYLRSELKKMGLDRFYDNVMRTIAVWFDSAPSDPVCEFITEFIFASGVYGTHTKKILAYAARDVRYHKRKQSNLGWRLLWAIFPSYHDMTSYYPMVKKCPLLLPCAWVYRWIKTLLFKRERIRQKTKDIQLSTDENVNGFQQELDFVGLDFNFKE